MAATRNGARQMRNSVSRLGVVRNRFNRLLATSFMAGSRTQETIVQYGACGRPFSPAAAILIDYLVLLCRRVAPVVRALPSPGRGRGFKPSRAYHLKILRHPRQSKESRQAAEKSAAFVF